MGQAAAEADISKSLVHLWELDDVSSPDLGKLLRLAAVIGVDPLKLCKAAGYDLSGTWPAVSPYFRSKYPELPDFAVREIVAITEKYGIDPSRSGPLPGEDER